MSSATISQDAIIRLLVSKYFLDQIRSLPDANPDRFIVARHVVTAHDAAELALAALARCLNASLGKNQNYLMDYFDPINQVIKEELDGKSYFSQLNTARNGFKHSGNFPDPNQWYRVGENTYSHVAGWCQKYLHISFDNLDESVMISDSDLKGRYDETKNLIATGKYKESLERVALALYRVFEKNNAVRDIQIGIPRAEDALKLSTFGIPANDFLSLQEFLPSIHYMLKEDDVIIGAEWEQGKFGHPANWTQVVAEFCLRTFLRVVLHIQDAEWIPGAISFDGVYEHKLTALEDDVEIINKREVGDYLTGKKVIIRTLNKGEYLLGNVEKKDTFYLYLMPNFPQEKIPKPTLIYNNVSRIKDPRRDAVISGEAERDKVKVTCVPRDDDWVKKHFPNLPEIDFE